MKRYIVFGVLGLLLAAGVGYAYLFFNTGGNKVMKMVKFTLSQTDFRKKEILREFYLKPKSQEISGFYAFTFNGRAYYWNLKGLNSFKLGDTTYNFFNICRLLDGTNRFTGSERLITKQDFHLRKDFLNIVKPGYYLTIRRIPYEKNKKMFYTEMWLFSGDFYMNTDLASECI